VNFNADIFLLHSSFPPLCFASYATSAYPRGYFKLIKNLSGLIFPHGPTVPIFRKYISGSKEYCFIVKKGKVAKMCSQGKDIQFSMVSVLAILFREERGGEISS